jgi:hypothetical protein
MKGRGIYAFHETNYSPQITTNKKKEKVEGEKKAYRCSI